MFLKHSLIHLFTDDTVDKCFMLLDLKLRFNKIIMPFTQVCSCKDSEQSRNEAPGSCDGM